MSSPSATASAQGGRGNRRETPPRDIDTQNLGEGSRSGGTVSLPISVTGNVPTLKDVIHDDVFNTELLVDAVNRVMKSKKDTQLIRETLTAYIEALNRLTLCDGAALREFAALAELEAVNNAEKHVMCQWFAELAKRTEDKHGDESVLKALTWALLSLDPDIFEGDTHRLVNLADVLVNKVDPKTTHIISVPRQQDILTALYHTFQLIVFVHPIEWDPSSDEGPFATFKRKVDNVVAEVGGSFPLLHRAKLVQQSIVHLSSQETLTKIRHGLKEAWKVAKGLVRMWNVLRSAATLGFDLESAEKAVTTLKDSATKGNDKEKWFTWLRCLNAVALCVAKDPTNFDCLLQGLEFVKKREADLSRVDRKHLRFGLLEQLTTLALSGDSSIRMSVKEQFLSFAFPDGEDPISADRDIAAHAQDCLSSIEGSGQQGSNAGAASSSSVSSSGSLFDKVRDSSTQTSSSHDRPRSIACILDPVEGLKRGYASDFSRPTENGVNISQIRFNLMRVTDTEKVLHPDHCVHLASCIGRELIGCDFKTEIQLKDIFPKDGNASEMIVMGMPGSGITTLGKRLAMDWASGTWGSHFTAVFMLSKSRLMDNKNEAWSSVSEAIVKNCFGHFDLNEHREDLVQFVQNELKMPTTLVILDGAEEEEGHHLADIIKQARHGPSKLLMLSHPRRVTENEALGVVELACMDRSDVSSFLCPEEVARRFHRQDVEYVQELARNPLNLTILLSKCCKRQKKTTVKRKSRAYYYGVLLSRLWKLCPRQANEGGAANDKEKDFDVLGKIALNGLESGQCSVSCDEIGDEEFCDGWKSILERGLLLCNCEGDMEFTHSIFLKYFSGRTIGRNLFSDCEKETAEDCLATKKYVPHYSDAFSIMAGEVGTVKGKEGINQLLRLIDQGKIESVGVHHLGLKMCLIQQGLLGGSTGFDYKGMTDGVGVPKELLRMMKAGMKCVRKSNKQSDDALLSALIKHMKNAPSVVGREEGVFSAVLEEMKMQKWDVDVAVVEALTVIIDSNAEVVNTFMDTMATELNSASERSKVCEVMRTLGGLSAALCRRMLRIMDTMELEGRDALYWETKIDLLKHASDNSDADIMDLAGGCVTPGVSRDVVVGAARVVLKRAPERVPKLLNRLLRSTVGSGQGMSPIVIDVLGICMKTSYRYDDDSVTEMLNAWPLMSDDQHAAACRAFAEAICAAPDRAAKIIGTLMNQDGKTPCQSLEGILLNAFSRDDTWIRSFALHTVAVCIRHSARKSESEGVGDTAGTSTEAARHLIPEDAMHASILPMCLEALGDDSSEVRDAAAKTVRAAIDLLGTRDAIVAKIVETYDQSSEAKKQGIVHSLRLISKDLPDVLIPAEPLVMNAVESGDPMLCSAGLSLLSILAMQTGDDIPTYVEVSNEAFQRQERSVKFSALEVLGTCAEQDPSRMDPLFRAMEESPHPETDAEWLTYLSALGQIVIHSPEKVETFSNNLLFQSEEESASVRAKRRSIIDHIPLDQLLALYEDHNAAAIHEHIARRMYQTPTRLGKKKKKIYDLSNESIENRCHPIERKMGKALRSDLGRSMAVSILTEMRGFLRRALHK